MKNTDPLILAIDQGTHSTRAIAFNLQGRAVARAQRPVGLQRLSHTAVEQSPDEILRSMQAVVAEALAGPAVAGRQVQAAGLATQRSSVLAWERTTGTALSPVLSWQDTRTADMMERLVPHAAAIIQATGLRLSPHYGGGKLQWLLEQHAKVAAAQAAGTLTLGPLASYLLHHLTDSHCEQVDHANASRTLLWNLETRDWDAQLLELFAIPHETLPVCRPICAAYGNTVNGDIPVTAVNGDQTAAIYAQGHPPAGTVMVNIGTGAFALLPVQDPHSRPAGLLAGISWSTEQTASHYVEGTVNGAGAALQWASSHFNVTGLEAGFALVACGASTAFPGCRRAGPRGNGGRAGEHCLPVTGEYCSAVRTGPQRRHGPDQRRTGETRWPVSEARQPLGTDRAATGRGRGHGTRYCLAGRRWSC
jgi:glycerol kinase